MIFLATLLFIPASLFSQVPDSSSSAVIDSSVAAGDSLVSPPPRKKSEVDAPIEYSARMIENLVGERITILTGEAVVKYKTATLQAGKITVDWKRNTLIAETLPDSLRPQQESSNGANDGKAQTPAGLPVFSDGGDRMTGEKMEYNFSTEKGRVLRGRTQLLDARYFGERIKRVGGNVLNISDASYTTCELDDEPHFHFQSRHMKIIVQDKVIARPVVFYLGKIPMAILPFVWFPTKSGRRSGLIVPRFGQSDLEGRYLRDLGYYWAASEYWDLRTAVDFFDRSGWYAKSRLNYNRRDVFNGSLSGSFTEKDFVVNDQQQRLWDVAIGHNHKLGQYSSLRIQGYYVSNSSFYKTVSDNRDQQLLRRLQSNATYSTSFGGGRSSLSINLSDTKDLENGSFQRSLPRVNFSLGQRQLFGSAEQSANKPGLKIEERPWYHNFYYSLSSTGEYSVSRGVQAEAPTRTLGRASHALSLSLNSPKRYFGWLSLNQSMPVNSDWFDRVLDYYLVDSSGFTAPLAPITAEDPLPASYDLTARGSGSAQLNQIATREEQGFAARTTFSYTASASTKLYGTFQPRIGAVQALRHVVTPSLSFSYRPDFSAPGWGYYEEITLPDGTKVKRDRFGGTSQGKLASLSFSLANLFQMKTGPEDKPKKIDLFNLNFFTGYNFAAREYRFADLGSTLQANPTRDLSLSMSTSHTFYDYNRVTGAREPGLLGLEGRFVRLTNFRFDVGLQLQGSGEFSSSPSSATVETYEEEQEEPLTPQELETPFSRSQSFAESSVPWNLTLGISYSYDRSNPLRQTKYAQLSVRNADIRLTKNWQVGVTGQFDLLEKIIVDQSYTIRRDLHCWEMQVFWTPSGIRKGFYMRISIKSPTLRDIKVERRGGRSSVFGGSSYY